MIKKKKEDARMHAEKNKAKQNSNRNEGNTKLYNYFSNNSIERGKAVVSNEIVVPSKDVVMEAKHSYK